MRAVAHGFIAAGLAVLTGCVTNRSTDTVALKIAVNDIYCTDTACVCVHDVAARSYAGLQAAIKASHGIDLQLIYFVEPYQLEEAILSGEYDGVLSKPWTALMLQEQSGASFQRIVDILDPQNNRWLTGLFIVRADAPFQSLEDLNGKHIYLGHPDAYEKNQAAWRVLRQRGITPARTSMAASCSENIGVLLDDEADAAVVSDYALSAGCAVDFANPSDFRILAHTERIPLTSLMIDKNKVGKAEAMSLQRALLALSGNHAPESLLSRGFIKPVPWNPPELEELP
jgi:ABC-type phosphate/phosphonate transport system substrate-binding protein